MKQLYELTVHQPSLVNFGCPDIATLCEICASIFSENSYERWSKFWQIWDQTHHYPVDQYPLPYPGRHHQSLQSLRDSMDRCCCICWGIDRCKNKSNRFPLKYRLRRLCESEDRGKETYELIVRGADWSHLSLAHVRPSSQLLTLRLLAGHDGTARVAKHWVRECLTNHDRCSKPYLSGWKPSRLLDVSKDKIQLVSGKSEEARRHPYITLSHCWGTQPFPVLTVTNMPVYIEGVDISEFELSFRDTIEIVRQLGVRYLWIDCYCIIQGSEAEAVADWKYESLLMGKVYANSLLNIGAADSVGPAYGLSRISPLWYIPGIRKMHWTSTKREGRKPYLITEACTDGHVVHAFETLDNSVLLTRGWVLQECALAPRMLSFGADKIFWQCAQLGACEGDIDGILSSRSRQLSSPFWVFENPYFSNQLSVQEIGVRWMLTLTDYCHRSRLTYPDKDLLVALDGIGAKLAKTSGSRFKYGIWDMTLPEALLYKPDSCRDIVPSTKNKTRPTWHWSSCYPEVNLNDVCYYGSYWQKTQYGRLAYAFMSDDCEPLPNESSEDFWPNLLVIGRLMSAPPPRSELFDTLEDYDAPYSQELLYLPLMYYWEDLFGLKYRLLGLILVQAESGVCCRVGTWDSDSILSSDFCSQIAKARPQLIVLG
ncbi:heterokaryon incompatibility protein-domain-containing protein [Xylaria scruposa]|nr:heterokaryon incompatibility protein-domain-containing protein [Xylaria scruposa]